MERRCSNSRKLSSLLSSGTWKPWTLSGVSRGGDSGIAGAVARVTWAGSNDKALNSFKVDAVLMPNHRATPHLAY